MANLTDFLKVLDFANAATTDSKMEQHFNKQLKSLFGMLSPNDKQKAKDKMDKKKKASGGKVYSRGSGTRKPSN